MFYYILYSVLLYIENREQSRTNMKIAETIDNLEKSRQIMSITKNLENPSK